MDTVHRVWCIGVANVLSLALLILVTPSRAQTYLNGGDYFQSAGGSSDCGGGYQPIEDVKACKEVAEKISGKNFGAIYHYYPVNPFPKFCTTKTDDVNYYVNPEGVHTDPLVSVLCINSALTCDVTDGSAKSSAYPCVCGPDTCATDEVCNGNRCEVIKGFYEAERKSVSCPSGYQVITDEVACQQLAASIGSKIWGAVDSYTTVAHGCTTWMTDTVNYYVNPGGTNTDIDVSLLCISNNMTCDVWDGSGVSSSYPCACGTDTCAAGEICIASQNLCEKIRGYVETERKAISCPSGYQVITDEAACQELAGMIGGEIWGAVYSYSEVAYGCTTMVAERVNYNVNPGGMNKHVENALLCISSNMKCDVSDGSGKSSSYPCACGTDTCADGEICVASLNLCETIAGYYETEREVNSCPAGYQEIIDADACRELASKMPGKTWGDVYGDTTLAHGCGTWLSDTINYYVNPGGMNTDVENSLLCISTNLTCDVVDGSGKSSSYPCACGADTCASDEICIASKNLCERVKGFAETERKALSCPSGYQAITDEAACQELAGMIGGEIWGAVYSYSEVAYGCTTMVAERVNYNVNPGGVNKHVQNALLCIDSNMTCDVSDGSGKSSSYPCACGTDTCADGEVCVASTNLCETIPGYYETDREVSACPHGYQAIADAAACRELAGKLPGKTWGAVYGDTTLAHGCGTWLSDTVNYYINPNGTNTDVENSLLCISTNLTCDVSDGSGVSSSYPCACGKDTCANNEVCIAAADRCEVFKGYYETERRVGSCPSGYKPITEAACWELANKLDKTWIKFPVYSGAASGCGTWNFDTVSFFDYPDGGAPKDDPLYVGGAPTNTENALLCVSETETIAFDQCLNPYAWGSCIKQR